MADLAFLTRHPVLRKLLLPAAGAIAFFLFLLLTFPYDALARRIEVEAQRNGADLTIGSIGPAGLGGVRARDVKVRFAPAPGAEALPDLLLDRLDVSPDFFALLLRRTSFGFSLAGYGGTARGHAALSNDPKQPGLSALRLDARQGFPVPKTSLGRVDGNVLVEKGVARLERTSARGGDIDADVDGNVSLRPLLSLSQADLHVRFRPSEKWLNENAMIKGAMGLIQNARQGDGSYLFSFTGPLARMTPRPGR